MMRYLVIIVFTFFQLSNGQRSFERPDLVPINDFQGAFLDSTEFIITERDTLVKVVKEVDDFELSPKITSDSTLLDYFYLTAFSNKRCLVFWKKPIVIHISDDFSDKIKADLKFFANELNKTQVVDISFTNDKEESNLVIINLPFIVNNYSKDLWEPLPVEQTQKLLYYNAGYNLFRQDAEIYAGAIKINLSRFKDDGIVSYKLKRLLFASMGFFTNHEQMSDKMFLKTIPEENTVFSDYDSLLLKIHYDHMTDYKINSYDIYKIYKTQ